MNRIVYLVLLIPVLFSQVLAQQAYYFTKVASANYTGNLLCTDDLGNHLIAAKANLTKIDIDGNFLSRYHPLYQGKISGIDAKDPRRIMLYYKEYSYVQFLNQELANTVSLSVYSINSRPEPVNLDILNLAYASLVCLDSYNEAYWVYDANSTDIVLIDQDNRIDFKADALDQIIDKDPNPNFMIMEGDRLFINNPTTGVYIFDENGSFVRLLPLVGLKKVQVLKDLMFYTTNNTLVVHHLITGEESYNPLPVLGFNDWAMSQHTNPMRISFLTNEGVMIYSLSEIIK